MIKPAPAYFTEEHAVAMTLRDYFAAKAMHALLLAAKTSKDVDLTANAAYAMADAMLEERTK